MEHGFYEGLEEVEAVGRNENTRLRPVLVRCGGCRFMCAAQDAAHLTRCVEAGGDYVRDYSQPASPPGRLAGAYREASRW
jgi:hypothetical protein